LTAQTPPTDFREGIFQQIPSPACPKCAAFGRKINGNGPEMRKSLLNPF
jgi:hypothetical protein